MILIQFSCLETAFHNHQYMYHRMLAEELNQSDQFEMECSIWQHGDVVWKIPVNNNQIIILSQTAGTKTNRGILPMAPKFWAGP